MMNSNRTSWLTVLVFSSLALMSMTQSVNAQGFTIVCGESQVTIDHDGKLVSRYHYRDAAAQKPYFWPVIGPKGTSMTRAFPMETVEGEQHDHPHHRGVWFGHQGVAGTDTWLEAASKKSSGDAPRNFLAGLGTIAHTVFTEISANQQRAVIRSKNDYLDSSGKKLMADERSMIFRKGSNEQLILDFDITLRAAYGDVELQDKKDAGLNVRVPTSMSLTHGKGHIINSSGDQDVAAWARKADWVDYHGTVDGKHVGVAFLNHPTSFRYPTRWHVRDYGLFTANAFGPQSLDANEQSGTFTLKGGDAIHLRHQIIFHEGDDKAAAIPEAFQNYAASKPN
jgi:Methane oxygenase PmoA